VLRRTLRRGAERALVGLGVAARARRRGAAGIAILAYHNVVPDAASRPAGDVSLHLPLSSFRRQLDRLMRTHAILPLAALTAPPRSDRPGAVVTFDDAYRGAIRLALPELADRHIPVTVFVSPALLGTDGFWWDMVASPDGRGLSSNVREEALDACRGRRDDVLARFESHAVSTPDHQPATLEELRRSGAPGVSFASHGWSHTNLTAVDPADLRVELERSRAWLAQHLGERALPDHLSFPYGLWNPTVAQAAFAAGYHTLYRVEGGPVADTGDPILPRINVPAGVSVEGFELRVSGAFS
jgi:peptidoglycan/xylan/chitin deacetylase (PgdA/CDA1 family)